MPATQNTHAAGGKLKLKRRKPKRAAARVRHGQGRATGPLQTAQPRGGQPATELQASRAEQMELRSANQALRQRIAALESELSTSRRQVELLRGGQRSPTRMTKPAPEPERKKRGRVFGAALFASLIGLGLRAAQRH
jgi:hypothetical protein